MGDSHRRMERAVRLKNTKTGLKPNSADRPKQEYRHFYRFKLTDVLLLRSRTALACGLSHCHLQIDPKVYA